MRGKKSARPFLNTIVM